MSGTTRRRSVSISRRAPVRVFHTQQPIQEYTNVRSAQTARANGPGPKVYSAYGATPSPEVRKFMKEGAFFGPKDKREEKEIARLLGNIRPRGVNAKLWANYQHEQVQNNNNNIVEQPGCFYRLGKFFCPSRFKGGKTRRRFLKKKTHTRRR